MGSIEKSSKDTVYFSGLNGLRFFAALAVVLTHIEFTKKLIGLGERKWVVLETLESTTAFQACWNNELPWITPLLSLLGEFGVVFFFVLSGFLITYLLLKEMEVSNTIQVGKFYLRRLLRIWPLYLLIVILGFFVLPHLDAFEIYQQQRYMWYQFWTQLMLHLFMLPNLGFAHFNIAIPNIGQAWSIGVEEQFYILWPLLIKFSKKRGRAIVYFLSGYILLKALIYVLPHDVFPHFTTIKRFIIMTKMECMAFGGLGAYMYYAGYTKTLGILHHRTVQIGSYLSILVVVYFLPIPLMPLLHIITGVSFLVIILNVATNPRSILKFRSKILDYLGKISYGIYMYHMMFITLSIYLINGRQHGFDRLSDIENFLVYGMSILGTILAAALSYSYFEAPWIRLKSKFTTILSGDSAKDNQT
jgi:peptidoglycan/LPS O-acetylase OafA/YrhL